MCLLGSPEGMKSPRGFLSWGSRLTPPQHHQQDAVSKSSGPLLGCAWLLLWFSPAGISVMFIKRWQVYQASWAVFHKEEIFPYIQGVPSILCRLWAQSLRVNKAPSQPRPLFVTISHWLPLPPLPGFVTQQEAAKEEMLYAWSVPGKETKDRLKGPFLLCYWF